MTRACAMRRGDGQAATTLAAEEAGPRHRTGETHAHATFALIALGHAWAASIPLVAVFFVGIPALILALILVAAVQASGERSSRR